MDYTIFKALKELTNYHRYCQCMIHKRLILVYFLEKRRLKADFNDFNSFYYFDKNVLNNVNLYNISRINKIKVAKNFKKSAKKFVEIMNIARFS